MKDKKYKKIQEELQKIHISGLSDSEKRYAWARISQSINEAQTTSLLTVVRKYRFMIQGAIALLILISAGGTAAASDNARPGDFLFPVDRAVENMRLVLASEERENELRLQFAEERVLEVQEIIAEETGSSSDDDSDSSSPLDSSNTFLEVEADVFTNETVIKVELGDKKTIIVTDDVERGAIIDTVVEEFDELTREEVDAVLDLEVEDRASRPGDKDGADGRPDVDNSDNDESDVNDDDISERGRLRIRAGIDEALTSLQRLLNHFEGDDSTEVRRIRTLIGQLEGQIDRLPENARMDVRIDRDSDELKIESRDGNTRIKIEIKNGEIEIETEKDSSDHGNDVRESEDEVFCRGEWRDVEDCDDSDGDDDSDNSGNSDSSDSDHGNDVRESEDEVFCRGEWRDAEDCDDFKDDDDDDDNSGHGSSDDNDDDDDQDEEDSSGHGSRDDRDDD